MEGSEAQMAQRGAAAVEEEGSSRESRVGFGGTLMVGLGGGGGRELGPALEAI